MSLATLPPELYSSILVHVPPSTRQITVLNLSRAIPHSPIPLQPLFEHIVISRIQQASQLYGRLCYQAHSLSQRSNIEGQSNERAWVKTLDFWTLQDDAEIIVNLLGVLPALEKLSLLIGTSIFPEHLEEIFCRNSLELKSLSLRFIPYVKKATYYQFLKGSYFDGTLELLSRRSSNTRLSKLSIIQDPFPSISAEPHVKSFAQPIVFFSLRPLTTLSISQPMQYVTHLRLRIPSREIIRFITSSKGSAANTASHFPSLVHIDLSTCFVHDLSEIEILINYTGRGRLQHVVLDKTGVCNGSEGEWVSVGRACALAGVRRMREREKSFKDWIEAAAARNQDISDSRHLEPSARQERQPRRGRRGLATATISLRDTFMEQPALPTDRSGPLASISSKAEKIRVLPPPPRLISLCISRSRSFEQLAAGGVHAYDTKARSEFSKGWSEGLSQLHAIWTRLRQSQANGVRLVRFTFDELNTSETENEMLEGLVDLGKPGDDGYWEELQEVEPPILCFAESYKESDTERELDQKWESHPKNCGHRIARETWGDNIILGKE